MSLRSRKRRKRSYERKKERKKIRNVCECAINMLISVLLSSIKASIFHPSPHESSQWKALVWDEWKENFFPFFVSFVFEFLENSLSLNNKNWLIVFSFQHHPFILLISSSDSRYFLSFPLLFSVWRQKIVKTSKQKKNMVKSHLLFCVDFQRSQQTSVENEQQENSENIKARSSQTEGRGER